MTPREERGLAIAAKCRINRNGNQWSVPSQSNRYTKYSVCVEGRCSCTCPDFEERGEACKHVYAVQYTIDREYSDDGTITQIETLTLQQTRKTYSQDWSAYNRAQTSEKAVAQSLLFDLCAGIPESTETQFGRPRLPLRDGIFCACLKVYSMLSSRRCHSDLCDAHEKGFISHVPHFNSLLNVFDSDDVTPVLTSLVSQSATPLAAIESSFAIDSTAFSGCRFDRWFDTKWKNVEPKTMRSWVKAHCVVGCSTNVITAARVLDKDSNDSPMLQPLMAETAERFTITDMTADKAYLSQANLQAINDIGANAFIPFKINSKPNRPGVWDTAYHYFALHRQEFLAHYHQRSNAESTFSAIKRKYGDSVKAKNDRSMKNEVLAKLICHNLSCLIHAMEEFGIDANFGIGRTTPLPLAR